MAVIPFTNGRIYIEGIDLSGSANQGTLELTAAELDASTISDAWDVFVMGRKKASLDAQGWWEAGPDLLFNKLGTANRPVSIYPDGDEGSVGYAMRAVPIGYSVGGAAGELMTFSVGARGDVGRAIRGTVLLDDSAAVTSTADGTAFQLGAVTSAQSVYAAMHVLAFSGTSPTLDVIVESDSSEDFDASPSTQITFPQASTGGAWWGTATGAITDTWWRVGLTVAGTNPSFTAVVLVAIH